MSETPKHLCTFCRQRHNACLAHDLHRTKAEKKRLRADLAMACTDHCPRPPRPTQEST